MAYCLINKSNYFYNLSQVEKRIDKDKIAVVIKNNAYGHGILEIGKLANEYGIKHAIVCTIEEASLVSHLFETILVLQDSPKDKVPNNLIITINSLNDINKIPKGTKVEIEVDTGMHRNGILTEELDLALKLIIESDLILNGVFTHFSNAYLNDKSLAIQKQVFDDIRNTIKSDNRFSDKIRFHCCASSSLFRLDNFDYDIARVGIATYGYISLPDGYKKPKLKPVLSLWAEKITSKTVVKGGSIGYGQTYTANEDIRVSTYDIGYGDGFMRLDQNKKSTIEDGREILGIVSMNSFTTFGTDEAVCVFNDAEKYSKVHNTIIYEIISNINPKIRREIVS